MRLSINNFLFRKAFCRCCCVTNSSILQMKPTSIPLVVGLVIRTGLNVTSLSTQKCPHREPSQTMNGAFWRFTFSSSSKTQERCENGGACSVNLQPCLFLFFVFFYSHSTNLMKLNKPPLGVACWILHEGHC